LPDPKVYHTLLVETEIALSKKQNGYDQNRVEKLLRAVAETMEEIGADEADIYTTQDRDMIITAERTRSAP
jgi:hypothetical protein